MSTGPNPIPVIIVLMLLKNKDNISIKKPVINTLQLEAFLDNAKTMLSAYDKVTSFVENSPKALPDIKKLMEIVEKLPL